jgi:phage virion morphogenesis protein
MTGATLTAAFEDGRFREGIEKLQMLTRDFSPLLKTIGVGMVKSTQHRFVEAKDPEGRAWHALNPVYAETKKGPGILRNRAMSGGLMGSITFKVEGTVLRVGSNKKYAAIHQFGGVIRPVTAKALVFRMGGKLVRAGSVKIPARPYLGFGKEDQVVALEAVDFFYSRALAVASLR